MNRAIVMRTARDALPILLIVCCAVVLLETMFVGVVTHLSKELEYLWMQQPLFRRFAKMMVGADLGSEVSAGMLVTIGYAHPILFALNWVFLLVTCTRLTAVEIDRGTADLLLTLPVSRGVVYTSASAVCVIAGVPIALATLVGTWFGATIFSLPEPPPFGRLAILALNLFALYLAVGGATLLLSAWSSRRGPAVAIMLAALLGSFLLNFLAQFWPIVERISYLGLLHYYRPLPVVRTGTWPTWDITVLLGVAVTTWVAGLWHFSRRDIPAA